MMMECSLIRNLESLCRLCLVSGVELIDIFQDPTIVSKYGAESSLVYKIMVATNLEVKPDDDLPHVICKTCSLKVTRSYEFRQQAKRSNEILRRYVQSKKYKELQQEKQEPNTDDMDHPNGVAVSGDIYVEGIEINADELTMRNVSNFSSSNFVINENGSVAGGEDSEEQSIIMPVDPLLLDSGDQGSDIDEANSGEILDGSFEPMWMNGNGVDVEIKEEPDSMEDENVDIDGQIAFDDQLTCQYCNSKFPTEDKFARHCLIHTPEPPFPCDYCDLSFDLRTDLKSHWRVHSNGNPHICQMCGKSFPDRAMYLKHSELHDEVKPYRCPVCNKSFCYGSDLRKHAITHTGVRPYVCSVCGNAFTRSTSLNKHLRMHNGNRPFPCPSCPKLFGSRGDLKRHQLIHSGLKPWVCAVCSVPFNRKDKLVRHERLHSGEPRPFQCFECPTSFSRKEDLTKHIQFHHYKAPNMSEKSLKNYPMDPDNLDKITTSDIARGNETFKLLIQEISVNTSRNLINNNQYAMSASKMDRTIELKQLESLKNDVQSVNDEMDVGGDDTVESESSPFECDICRKAFRDKNLLEEHKKNHTAVKPFSCSMCEKSFYRRRELTRHEAVHTGYKPFTCGVCGKCFSRTDKLNRHIQTHEYKSTYRNICCQLCSLNFRTEQEYNNHKTFCCPDDVNNLSAAESSTAQVISTSQANESDY